MSKIDNFEAMYQFLNGKLEYADTYKEYLATYFEVMQTDNPNLKEEEILKLFINDIFKEAKNI